MLRSASPTATADMNGCAMPPPAPCASTKQARVRGGACRRPETCNVSSIVIVTGSACEEGMDAFLNEEDAAYHFPNNPPMSLNLDESFAGDYDP